MQPREPARRTYVIDDFERWDDAIHAAAQDFERAFGSYPTHATVHPGSLERFGMRASPEKLRDSEGDTPAEGDLDDTPHLGEFATDDYVLAFEEDVQ